ncbi:MAG: hypothetical protein DHS20C17_30480 [Cyclobacteriaceae bacterium]|nr:MAG: hypothetical protein DHS20C17_30480 [Cyclobacteriaceae bacterium]
MNRAVLVTGESALFAFKKHLKWGVPGICLTTGGIGDWHISQPKRTNGSLQSRVAAQCGTGIGLYFFDGDLVPGNNCIDQLENPGSIKS